MGKSKSPPLPDWQPRRPPPTPAERKVIEEAKKQNELDRIRAQERIRQEEKDTLKRWHKEREEREKAEEAKLKLHGVEWADRRTRCVQSFLMLSGEITARKNDWENHVIDVSIEYENAYKAFGELLSEETNHNQLMWTLAFTALGSVASGGIVYLAAKAGDKWFKSESQKLFLSAANDTVQGGVSGLLGVAAPMLAEKYEVTDIPSPFKIQGEWKKLLNDMETEMVQWSNAYQKIIKDMPLKDFENFDPQKLDNQIARFLEEKDRQFKAQRIVLQGTKDELKKELEKMMVGLYAVAFLEKELTKDRKVLWGLAEKAVKRMPDKVIDRLADFEFVENSRYYSDVDVLKVAKFGPNTERAMKATVQRIKAYRPKKFG